MPEGNVIQEVNEEQNAHGEEVANPPVPMQEQQQQHVAREHPPNDALNVRIRHLEIHFDATGLPSVIFSIGAVSITAYTFYKILNSEKLFGICVDKFCPNSVRIDMVAEDKNSAEHLLRLLFSGELLRLMNKELQKYLEFYKAGSCQFGSVELIHYDIREMKEIEFETVKAKSAELRTKYQQQDPLETVSMPQCYQII